MNLHGVREGTESFEAFALRTRSEWNALAAYICRRVSPRALDHLEDVVQELLLECWQRVATWDPNRGCELDRYCVFNAVSQVTRRLKGRRSDPLSARNLVKRSAELDWERAAPDPYGAVVLRVTAEQVIARCFGEVARKAATALVEERGDVPSVVKRLRAGGLGREKARAHARAARQRFKEAYAQ